VLARVLAAQLPGPIVEELADGLTETYRSYRTRGLPADAAAEAALAIAVSSARIALCARAAVASQQNT
jgi:hypothetical protein